jgi:hypothetical protein
VDVVVVDEPVVERRTERRQDGCDEPDDNGPAPEVAALGNQR